eukprot:TRINITY_DN5088_c0_g1_i1.p1 TRINITY_DN5088_c0_g1~~TRINITY_DN5088_c0_g1_i1.p1  ORF type:complete len:185 (-),score=26.10 TRINITY_DN5088_c0_g1_i1:62-616(-)
MEYRIVLLGSGSVGKSAITIQFIKSMFIIDYDPTIEDCYSRQCEIDNEHCMISILDTAGQEEFKILRAQHIKQGQGYLLIFSIDDLDSFHELENIINTIQEIKSKKYVPMILMGNKCDLEKNRVIKKQVAQELANKYRMPYFETSALKRLNIDESFYQCVREIRKDGENNPVNIKDKKSFCFVL